MSYKTPSVPATPAKGINQSAKKHIRGSTLLLAGRVISMVTNFAVQILTVRYLSKSDYGAFAYAMSLVSLGASLAVFGLDKTTTRFLPMYQERGEYSKLFGGILMMVSTILSIGFFLVLLVFGLQGWIAQELINDPVAARLVLILIFLSPISALDSFMVGMLAIFAKPSAIFFRRHVLGPGLKLLVVVLLIVLQSDVYFLSAGNLIAGALGVLIYSGILIRDLKKQGLWSHFDRETIKFPVKEIFSFSLPLLTTNFVYLIRSQLVIVMLEYFRSTTDVASFRAVFPVADLNTVVIHSFTLLFMPVMARMYAKEDHEGVGDMYWQSAVWITIISLPIFLVTFSLAEPLTVLLFGERYAQSGLIMALLAFGFYFNAALGFNADTLRVYGRIRYVVIIDFLAMLISLVLNLLLIPRYGALGAAIGTLGTLVFYNTLNHIGLKFATKIDLFQMRYLKVYASIILGSAGLVGFQAIISPPIYVGFVLAGLVSLVILVINRDVLNIEQTFPELLRFPLVRTLFGVKKNENTESQ